MKIIGSKTIVLEKGRKQRKFEPKEKEYIFVGYSNESKAYRLWQQGTKRIIKSRDVHFIENISEPTRREHEPLFVPLDFDQNKDSNYDSTTEKTIIITNRQMMKKKSAMTKK